MNELLQTVSKSLEPVPHAEIPLFTRQLKAAVTQSQHDITMQVGGSYAKGTHSGSHYDVDIFLRYHTQPGKPLSDYTETVLKNIDKPYKRIPGSRDYFVIEDAVRFEIVPVLYVETPDQAETVVDVSPLHVAYVKEQLQPEQKKDIRLLKQFLKAHEIYGAESWIGGFSGHVVDLLILQYGSFTKVLQATKEWEPKTVIDIESYHDTPLLTLNQSKTQGPLIIIDPIQPQRNAAAAVRKNAFQTLKRSAALFLQNPTKQAFRIPTLEDKRNTFSEKPNAFEITVTLSDRKHDIQGAKLVKIEQHIQRKLQKTGHKNIQLQHHHTEEDSVILVSAVQADRIETTGPPTTQGMNADAFKSAHEQVIERKGRFVGYDKLPYTTVKEALTVIIADPYVQERCESITITPI